MLTITTCGRIAIDGKSTGYGVTQTSKQTAVYAIDGERVTMPHQRYALSTDHPASGMPGRLDFQRDLIAAIR